MKRKSKTNEDKLPARQPSEDDREVLAKRLRDIGAVRKVDQDCSCQDCEGAAEWVNAPLSVVLDHFKTNVSDAEPALLVCAWCPQPARGDAWHNDGKLHPSCGQIDHGQGWVPPYTPRAAVPDAATELAQLMAERDAGKQAEADRAYLYQLGLKLGAERDAALAAIERIRQAVSGHPECDRYEEGDVISCGWKSAYASVVAALDGAPELDRYDDFCPTCDAPNPWHTAMCAVPFRSGNSELDVASEPECEWRAARPIEGESKS